MVSLNRATSGTSSRWVLVDFAGVVGDHQPKGDKDAMTLAAAATPDLFWNAYWAFRDQYDRAVLTAAEYWSDVVRTATGQAPDDATISQLIQLDVSSWLHPQHDTLAVLADLCERGHPLALLSNAPMELADSLDRVPWLDMLSGRFYSSRLGRAKPDPEVYRAVVAALGAAPEDIVFVDDRPANVTGAQAVGMVGLVFTSSAALARDLAGLLAD